MPLIRILKFIHRKLTLFFVETSQASELNEAFLRAGIIARLFPNGVRITLGFPEQNDVIREVLAQF